MINVTGGTSSGYIRRTSIGKMSKTRPIWTVLQDAHVTHKI